MANVNDIKRVLKRYTTAAHVDGSLEALQKVSEVRRELTRHQAAQLVYLACATTDGNRTRAALAAQRAHSPTAQAIEAIERVMTNEGSRGVDGLKTARNTGAVTVIVDGNATTTQDPVLRSGDGPTVDQFPGRMIKELVAQFQARQEYNAATPGYVDGQPIQVRGGASKDWQTHAKAYVIR